MYWNCKAQKYCTERNNKISLNILKQVGFFVTKYFSFFINKYLVYF